MTTEHPSQHDRRETGGGARAAALAGAAPVQRPRPLTGERIVKAAVLAVVAVVVAHALDGVAHRHIVAGDAIRKDYWYTVRVFGALYLWVGVAVVFVIDDLRPTALRPHLRDAFSRAVVLLMSATLAGGVAELGKLTFRRSRPPESGAWSGGYVWNWPPADGALLSSSGMGLPSSHTAVAFGAAAALAYLHPRYAWVWIAVACGTGLQRIADRAHYLSDVTLAAVIGFASAAVVWRLHWWLLDRSKRAL